MLPKLPTLVVGLSLTSAAALAVVPTYSDNYGSAASVDQAAYQSAEFWKEGVFARGSASDFE